MVEIGVACIVAALFELTAHWFPWQLILRRRLPRLAAYVVGMCGVLFPLSGLEIFWMQHAAPAWGHLVGLWAVAICAGLATGAGYGVDWLGNRISLAHELREVLEQRDGRSDLVERN